MVIIYENGEIVCYLRAEKRVINAFKAAQYAETTMTFRFVNVPIKESANGH